MMEDRNVMRLSYYKMYTLVTLYVGYVRDLVECSTMTTTATTTDGNCRKYSRRADNTAP